MPTQPTRRPIGAMVRRVLGAAAAGSLPLAAGCSVASATGAAELTEWVFVLIAFGCVGGLAYLVGTWRERGRWQREAQRAAAEAAAWRLLQRGATWTTDAGHGLASWRAAAPGDVAPPPPTEALRAALASERPFRDLPLAADDAGGTRWRLDGEPLRDALGRFEGYRGSARPAQQEDQVQLAQAALAPLVDAWPGIVLLASGAPAALRVALLNQAARTQWPQASVGAALTPLLAALPARVSAALAGPPREPAADIDGWQVLRFALGGDAVGLLLARVQPGAAGPGEAEAFGQTLSHDLRAPIRVVEGFTRIVKEDYGHKLDRVANDHLDRVLGAVARMNLMIDALLTLARLSSQPLARQPVNLSQIAGYVVDDLRRAAPERAVEVQIEPGLVAQGDPTLLRMVLENLLANAWKYTARVGLARITLRATEHDGRRCYEGADNGAGFDMRSADRLFGLFQRLHSQTDFPGHGVGLASVQRIVQRHGGRIWAQAEPGRGATFSFTLA